MIKESIPKKREKNSTVYFKYLSFRLRSSCCFSLKRCWKILKISYFKMSKKGLNILNTEYHFYLKLILNLGAFLKSKSLKALELMICKLVYGVAEWIPSLISN